MKKEPSSKILVTLAVWAIISCLFPFPVSLVIMFIGGVLILILAGLADYFAEEEKKKSVGFIEEKKLPPVSEAKKKTKSNLSGKHRPKIRVELEVDRDRE